MDAPFQLVWIIFFASKRKQDKKEYPFPHTKPTQTNHEIPEHGYNKNGCILYSLDLASCPMFER